MKDYAAVRRFQVVQDQPDHVELRVVAGPSWADVDRNSIESIVRRTLGDRTRFELRRVDDIPLTGAGKLRVVVNLCSEASAQVSSN
jgi:phenylacetate-CoA ligase